MAVSGGSSALVLAGAKKLGESYKSLAAYTNWSTAGKTGTAEAITASDRTGHVGRVAFTGLEGGVRVYWGDGTVTKTTDAQQTTGYVEHTYAGAGSKAIVVTASGRTLKATLSIA